MNDCTARRNGVNSAAMTNVDSTKAAGESWPDTRLKTAWKTTTNAA